jgi:hypothetical protein
VRDTLQNQSFCTQQLFSAGIFTVNAGATPYIEFKRDFGFFNYVSDYYTCLGQPVQQISFSSLQGSIYTPDPPNFTPQQISNVTEIYNCTQPYPICNNCAATFAQIDTVICQGTTFFYNGVNYTTAGTYGDTLSNAAGCDSIVALIITVATNLQLQITGDTTLCPGQTTSLQVANLPTNAVYKWRDALGAQVGDSSTITVLSTGFPITYTVEVIVGGCIYRDTTTVTTVGNFVFNIIAKDSTCAGSAVQLNGPQGYLDYQWSNGNTLNNQTISNIQASAIFTLTVTDANGCTSTDTHEIVVDPNPSVSITGPNSVCLNNSITLEANAAQTVTYQWSLAGAPQTDSIAITPPLPFNTYTVTVTDQNGCTATSSTTVTTSALIISLGVDTSICKTGQVKLEPSISADSVKWYNATLPTTILSNAQSFIANMPGIYFAIAYQGVCSARDTVEVRGNTMQLGSEIVTPSTCFDQSGGLKLSPSNGRIPYSAIWADNTTFTGLERNNLISGTYSVTTSDVDGCTQSAQLDISTTPPTSAQLAMIQGPALAASCFDTITVHANLPHSSATGKWTAAQSSSSVQFPNSVSSLVENLMPGGNTLYWTLSTSQCPDYSTDSVVVGSSFHP